jgi:hypothetical protein
MLRLFVEARRQELVEQLEVYYRSCGWKVRRESDGTVRADGPGGVTWIGLVVVGEDLDAADFEARLLELSDQRVSAGGQLCPLELLPAEDCEERVRGLLARLRLDARGHVGVYSLAA